MTDLNVQEEVRDKPPPLPSTLPPPALARKKKEEEEKKGLLSSSPPPLPLSPPPKKSSLPTPPEGWTHGEQKESTQNTSGRDSKELESNSKEEPKNNSKEESKNNSKEEPKNLSKEEPKNNSKEEPKSLSNTQQDPKELDSPFEDLKDETPNPWDRPVVRGSAERPSNNNNLAIGRKPLVSSNDGPVEKPPLNENTGDKQSSSGILISPRIEKDQDLKIFSEDDEEPDANDPEKKTPAEERADIINELWDTESQYVQDLYNIVHLYLIPLRDTLPKRADILKPADIPKIFDNVEKIYSVNQSLLEIWEPHFSPAITPETVDQAIPKICEVFIKQSEFFRIYASYGTNQPVALETLTMASRNPLFVSYENTTRESTGKVRLDGFIVKPVQRVCKYPLFFRDLLKTFHPEEELCGIVKQTLEKADEVATYINEYKHQKENKEKLEQIQSQLKGYKKKIDISTREFFREGFIEKLRPTSTSSFQERKFWLFNDVLIYAEGSKAPFQFRGEIPVHQILVREFKPNPKKKQDKRLKNMTTIEMLRVDTRRVYTLCCKNSFEKNEWVKAITKAVDLSTMKLSKSQKVSKRLIWENWNKDQSEDRN